MYRFLKFLIPAALLVAVVTVVTVSAMALGNRDAGPVPGAELEVVALDVPSTINYQGFLTDDLGDPVDGTVKLQFDLFKDPSGGIALWSQTYNSVSVDQGYFAVQLGPLEAADFHLPVGSTTLFIQVSLLPDGGGSVAFPRQPLSSAPYAFLSQEASVAPWDGLTGVPPGFADNIDDVEFQNVVTVAKSGAQFTSIQEAIDSITDADDVNRYLVWVGPGHYQEQVFTKPNVYLTGAGRWLTWIESDVSNPDIYPPVEATLHLASQSNVSNLTAQNLGTGYRNVAILAEDGTTSLAINNVTALTNGPGEINYGIFLTGANTGMDLQDVNSYCIEASFVCVSMEVATGADAWVQGGFFGAYSSEVAIGVVGADQETNLELFNVHMDAADTSSTAIGLQLNFEAVANLHGGRVEARNGYTDTIGINVLGGSYLEASGVMALGHVGALVNNGLIVDGGNAFLRGGSYHGFGGDEAHGLMATGGGYLEADEVTAKGQFAYFRNDGLRVEGGAVAMLNGGFYYGDSGGDNRGIAVYDENSVVDVQHATVQGEGGQAPGGGLADSFGVSSEFSSEAYITLSELYGVSEAVLSSGAATRIELTRLVGGAVGGTTPPTCVAVTYASGFYAETCP